MTQLVMLYMSRGCVYHSFPQHRSAVVFAGRRSHEYDHGFRDKIEAGVVKIFPTIISSNNFGGELVLHYSAKGLEYAWYFRFVFYQVELGLTYTVINNCCIQS